jgi:hypothetical protein
MSQGFSVCRRGVEVVHLKLLSIHHDDVSFRMPCPGLLVQHLDLPFNDVILSLTICPGQCINVPENMRKIVQVDPEEIQTIAKPGPIQLFSPFFFHLKTKAVKPPISAPMPMSNRKHASANTPLLPLVISKTVVKSEAARKR